MSPEEIAEARTRRYNGSVLSIQKPNSDLMILRVKPDFPIMPHRAGQYCTLGLGNWEPRFPGCQEENLTEADESKVVRRAYSISHSIMEGQGIPAQNHHEWLEFYITLVREGSNPTKPPALTPRLFMLREGERLNIGERITGHYTLEYVKPNDTVIFLGTGTGEAPHNYMTWELLQKGHTAPILHVNCVRYKRDLGYLGVHADVMKRFPNYKYLPLTTREIIEGGKKLYIQDLIRTGQIAELLGGRLDPETTHVYLCGNPSMIGVPVKNPATGEREYPKDVGVIEILEKLGFQCDNSAMKFRGNIHFEEYW